MVKRMMAGLMSLLLLCLFVGCGNRTLQAEISESVQERDESLFSTEEPETEHTENKTPDSDGQKILVAYFSRTGNTESLANEIGTYTGGELFEIVPVEPYPVVSGADGDPHIFGGIRFLR